MSTKQLAAEVAALEQRALSFMRADRHNEAHQAWAQVLRLQPDHVAALTQVGQAAFKQGQFAEAHAVFVRAAELDPQTVRRWINVSLACQQLRDEAGEEAALFKALTADPYDLLALVLRGALFERQGKTSQAASAYGAVAAVAPPAAQLSPDLRPAVEHARQYCQQHNQALGDFLDERMAEVFKTCEAADVQRFKLSMDILVGRKRRFDPQPMRYFFPNLPAEEFFDRARFPWLDDVEAAHEAIRGEFLAVYSEDAQGFSPYITYGADQPVSQWQELNHSPRWSAFHLMKDGLPVAENVARCPQTMAVWGKTPSPQQPGRTPVAMFSLLKPKTRIPPHVGASNCRLVTHLPLIVPPNCGFRVGNQTREWVPGKAWVFDDTIEHEAWNDSDQLRVVLIFDTWHPALTPQERVMISAMNTALNDYSRTSSVDYDV